jgi:hypothetical protein
VFTGATAVSATISGSGYGISALGANLTLAIPLVAEGPYASTLTITAVTSLA